mmetsp:Transcript_31148/g.88328  ORF Transcript_31148/g.88328 Transcript_31148/m.88328 type:complete len:131 (+) Transcript_31148:169-561(+)
MSLATKLPFYQIDAFTRIRFSGNPAAICLVPKGKSLPSETMQKIAAENNLAETAFLELGDGPTEDFSISSCFGLRWFTPQIEVPLCGHATLASAAALFFGKRWNTSASEPTRVTASNTNTMPIARIAAGQ